MLGAGLLESGAIQFIIFGVMVIAIFVLIWAFTIWGTALYLWSGVVYLHQIIGLLRSPVRQPVP